jgi:hypothetical protein
VSTSKITLNGRSYDAITGNMLTPDSAHKIKQAAKSLINDITPSAHHGSSPAPVATPLSHPYPQKALQKPLAKKRATHSLKAHRPQPSKTLARRGVKKPLPLSSKAKARVQPAVDSAFTLAKTHAAPLTSYAKVNAERLQRASHTHPSKLISHFKDSAHPEPVQPRLNPLAVQPAKQPQAVEAVAKPTQSATQKQFDAVLRGATSHTQPAVKPARQKKRFGNFSNRFVAIIVAAVAVIIVGGFVFTQNAPQIDTRLASLHAGFSVSLPSYQPVGFAFVSHVQASPGKAVVSYRSTTNQGEFSIAQQTTNWNDQTLHAYVASTGQSLQTWQDKGRTVYLYGTNLTWVSDGIWYQITNNANLSPTQLLDIATSM